LNSASKRRTGWIIAFLMGLVGFGHLVAGGWMLFAFGSLNVPERASAFSSLIKSLDPSLVTTPELRSQISNIKTGVVEELNLLHDISQYLNVIPSYLILQGIIFMALSLAFYFLVAKKEKGASP
jgi:hypothetical protein